MTHPVRHFLMLGILFSFIITFPLIFMTEGTAQGISSKSDATFEEFNFPNAPVIRIGLPQNPPFGIHGNGKPPRGFSVDILRHIATLERWNLAFVEKPWPELISMLDAGEIDLLSGIAYTPARAKKYNMSNEAMANNWGLIYRRPDIAIDSIVDLDNKRIAIIPKSVHASALEKLSTSFGFKYTKVPAKSYGETLALVDSGKADAGVVARSFHIMFGTKYKALPTSIRFNPIEVRFAAPKGKGAEILAAIDTWILIGKNDPASLYNRLLSKWFDGPTEKSIPLWVIWGAAGSVGILLLSIIFVILLRKQVKTQTTEAKKSEQKYREIFENAAEGIFQATFSGNLITANPAMATILGYTSPEELIKKISNIGEQFFINPDDRDECIDALASMSYFNGKEMQWRCKDGAPICLSISARSAKNNEGEKYFNGTIQDISERKQAEIALLESEERLAMAMQASNAGLWIRDFSKGDIFWSDENFRLLGYKPSEVNASYENWLARLHPDDQERTAHDLLECFENKSDLSLEYRIVHSDGSIRWINNVGKTLTDEAGNRTIACGIQIDITEHKELELQLHHAQRLEAIGQLTGGIAHDFNNILSIVQGNFEILQHMLADNEKALSRIKTGLKGTARGADLTRKLLNFSRKEVSGIKRIYISDFIYDLEDLLIRSLTVSINIAFHLDEDDWPVDVDPGDFQDVIINLAVNARDAMPDGGHLVIEVHNKVIDADYSRRNPQSQTGEFVMLSVSDTGHGMSAEVKEHILEPFFTTKELGKGTGLGLSMVYGFIKRSRGHLKIYSEIDKGTTFRLYLPRAKEHVATSDTFSAPEITELPHGTETILVVDDEKDLRNIAVFHLEELGYKIIASESGSQALGILRNNDKIDLLFSDIIMPDEIDGYRLAMDAHKLRPDLKILLTSGFSKKITKLNSLENEYLAELNANLLSKPYNKSDLAKTIRRILDET